MQESARRSQHERSETMRAALLRAGRDLFVRNGYAATGTPDIALAAGVTRGALYHHFRDKADLFAAVVRAEASTIATEIEASGSVGLTPIETLIQGGEAFLAAMRIPGRARLMLVEAPAALGSGHLGDMDALIRARGLESGLHAAGIDQPGPLAALLSAAYDRAALAIDRGEPPGPWRMALKRMLRGVVG